MKNKGAKRLFSFVAVVTMIITMMMPVGVAYAVDITETLTVSSPSTSGFTLTVNPALDNLTTSNFTLLDSLSNPITITSATTSDSGATYVISAVLSVGQTYTIAATFAGYDFGTAQNVVVPTPETLTVSLPATTGFTVTLNPALPGLIASNFTLLDSSSQVKTITGATTSNGGATYVISTDLSAGQTYTVTAAKTNYTFGTAQSVVVPAATITETLTVSNPATAGFTVTLSPALPYLTANSFTLLDSTNHAIPIASITTTNNGASYAINATLSLGQRYTVTATKTGYIFATRYVVVPSVTETLTVSKPTTTGFTVTINPALAGLIASNFTLLDSYGHPVIITGATTSDNGATYVISAALKAGQTKTVTAVKSGYTFGTAQNVVVPATSETMTVSKPSTTGFTVTVNPKLADLTASDFTLLDSSSYHVALTGATTSDGGATYVIGAALKANQTYTVTAAKTGYTFATAQSVVVPAAAETLTVSKPATTGFTVTIKPALVGLTASNFTLLDSSSKAVPITGATTSDNGSTYVIRAVLGVGNTYKVTATKTGYTFGTAQSVVVPAPPASVTGLSITSPSSNQLDLTWSKISGATSYKIYRASSATGTFTSIGTSSLASYKDMNLTQNPGYYYKVSAVNANGEGTPSSVVKGTTKGLVPVIVTGLSVTSPSSNELSLTWSILKGATSYKIYRSTSATGTFAAVGTSTTAVYSDKKLTANTTYYYKVSAVNANGEGIQSGTLKGTTKGVVPASVTGLSVTSPSSNELSLTWSILKGATSYKIYRSTSATGTFAAVGTSTTAVYSDKKLTANTTYYYKVSAVNPNGEGIQSGALKGTTKGVVPVSVTGLSVTSPSSNELSLTWKILKEAASYKIYRSTSAAGKFTAVGTSTTAAYSDKKLTANATYYYKVSAVNSNGEGISSSVVKGTTKGTVGK